MPNSNSSLFAIISGIKIFLINAESIDRDAIPGLYKLLIPLQRFIELYDEKIDEYYPYQKIEQAVLLIDHDSSVRFSFSNQIQGIFEIYALYKIIRDVMDRYYMTVHERRNVNQLVRLLLIYNTNVENARQALSNEQISDRAYLRDIDNRYIMFRDATLIENIRIYLTDFLREADEFEERSRQTFPNLDHEQFQRQYLEILAFDERKFGKKIFPLLYDTIIFIEGNSQRHKRLLLFNVFHVIYQHRFLSEAEWLKMDRGDSTYETYQDNQVRNFIGV